ncbi:uncharacterized protein LAESUDRAFT_723723 [Laetiporus sulphureus 93-53]|uniref:Uncharacterized protein n=1 Tax=Laetiporus sulphureus 93-53 TaxID=1314785 RepID=A0A165FD35_9APHY|nr:uncharacterized protein LAESUDRAFT_723723 [Laetiporus sulphureus 93-53]KZT08787.1 hypothetical protein LAESUDRAFT_723723 [Laetiporus sulphureus 93-53]
MDWLAKGAWTTRRSNSPTSISRIVYYDTVDYDEPAPDPFALVGQTATPPPEYKSEPDSPHKNLHRISFWERTLGDDARPLTQKLVAPVKKLSGNKLFGNKFSGFANSNGNGHREGQPQQRGFFPELSRVDSAESMTESEYAASRQQERTRAPSPSPTGPAFPRKRPSQLSLCAPAIQIFQGLPAMLRRRSEVPAGEKGRRFSDGDVSPPQRRSLSSVERGRPRAASVPNVVPPTPLPTPAVEMKKTLSKVVGVAHHIKSPSDPTPAGAPRTPPSRQTSMSRTQTASSSSQRVQSKSPQTSSRRPTRSPPPNYRVGGSPLPRDATGRPLLATRETFTTTYQNPFKSKKTRQRAATVVEQSRGASSPRTGSIDVRPNSPPMPRSPRVDAKEGPEDRTSTKAPNTLRRLGTFVRTKLRQGIQSPKSLKSPKSIPPTPRTQPYGPPYYASPPRASSPESLAGSNRRSVAVAREAQRTRERRAEMERTRENALGLDLGVERQQRTDI